MLRDSLILPPSHLCLPYDATFDPKVPVEDDGDYSEWGMWRRALQARQNQLTPPTFIRYPEGTWAYNPKLGDYLYLMAISIDDRRLLWHECRPNGDDHELAYAGKLCTIEKYIQWITDGSLPPPIHGYETRGGSIFVRDGHHRAAALWRSGIRTTYLWCVIYQEASDGLLRHAG